MRSPALIDTHRHGFGEGHTPLTREGETSLDTGVDFGIVRAREGTVREECDPKETAWLLMDGEAEIAWDGGEARVRRGSLFDEPPTALHVPGRHDRAHPHPEPLVGVGAGARGERGALRADVVRPVRARARIPRPGAGAEHQPAQRAADLRRRQPQAGEPGAGRGRELPGALVELPAAPPRAAGDLPLPLHAAPGLRARGAGRRRVQGAQLRHDQDHGRALARPGLGPRLRHVLHLDRPAPARATATRASVTRRSTSGCSTPGKQGWRPEGVPGL